MSLLEVSGLAVSYGPVKAVRGVDVDLDPGHIAVILGANGAGKSSTLQSIAGSIPKTKGKVTFDGKNITRSASHAVARAGLVMVPEGRRIFAPLTVEENLQIGGYTNRSGESQREILARAYEMFPILFERRHGKGGLLSGGEQQMLAFGRALMAAPKVILMDEPSMGLSPVMVDFIMTSIRRIAEEGIAILMAEQNAVAALDVADAVLVLTRGRVVLRGEPETVGRHPEVVRAFLGDIAAEAL